MLNGRSNTAWRHSDHVTDPHVTEAPLVTIHDAIKDFLVGYQARDAAKTTIYR